MNASPARPYLGIGEVLAKLRADFPDVSVSKIRFLESEGLIAPARSPSGYRKFAVADVERLRYILTAQRDHYLPLRVIRERLPAGPDDSPDGARAAALAPDTAGVAQGPGVPQGPLVPAQPPARGARLSRRELLDAAGIDDEQLAELEDFGLLRREGRQYGQHALEVARTVAELAAYGVQARHLRAVRAAAERETSLIEQVIAPTLRQRNAAARENAAAAARQIAALSLRLHRALIEAALTEAGLAGPGLPDSVPAWPGLARDAAARGSAVRDSGARDSGARDVSARDVSARDVSARDVSARDAAVRDAAGGGRASREFGGASA
jgi:DNA-binding transcriptional MerR regulator